MINKGKKYKYEKIIFVHQYNDRSGSPKVLSEVIDVAINQGVNFEILTSNDNDGFLSKFEDNIRPIFYKRTENKLLTFICYIITQIQLLVLGLLKGNKNTLFYINTMLPVGAAIAAKITGAKVIFHIHETCIKPDLFKSMLRKIIEHTADEVIFVSNYLKETERFNSPKQSIVYNGIASQEHRVVPFKDQNGMFNVLMLCSLKVYKGVHQFIQIAKKLESEAIKFTLVLNASKDEVERFLSTVDIPKNVKIYPRNSKVSSFYLKNQLVLNLSDTSKWIETFGLTIVEAFSFGLPVIAPPIGGPKEIVEDGNSGYLIDSKNISDISDLIFELSINENKYKALSENSYFRSQYFSLSKFSKRIYPFLCC